VVVGGLEDATRKRAWSANLIVRGNFYYLAVLKNNGCCAGTVAVVHLVIPDDLTGFALRIDGVFAAVYLFDRGRRVADLDAGDENARSAHFEAFDLERLFVFAVAIHHVKCDAGISYVFFVAADALFFFWLVFQPGLAEDLDDLGVGRIEAEAFEFELGGINGLARDLAGRQDQGETDDKRNS